MQARICLLFLLLCMAAPGRAQLTFDTQVAVPSTAPVLNKPYTAEKHEHREQRLKDGTLSTHDYDIQESRDSSGVIAVVSHQTAAGGVEQNVQLEQHLVINVAAHTVLQWTNTAQTGKLIYLPPVPVALETGQQPQPENLGHRVIESYAVTGTRTETKVAGMAAGSATPLRSIQVVWRSDALQMVMESSFTSPQTGMTSSRIVNLHPGAPDPALFHVPAGYTVQEVGSRPLTIVNSKPPIDEAHLPAMSYDEAMGKLDDPASAPIAAAVLLKMEAADTDLARRDKAVYTVARKGLDLQAAEPLAQADVLAGEQALADQPQPPTHTTLLAEHHLARYWDTLGYLLSREQKDGTRYLLAAWTVDPLAYYGSHLGHEYEEQRMSSQAIAVYRAAAEADGSPEMKQLVRDRLNALAGPTQPQAVPASASPSARVVVSIQYSVGKPAEVRFLRGEAEVGTAGAAAAASAAKAWTLPDAGPEQVIRLVAVTCKSRDDCMATNLPAHEP